MARPIIPETPWTELPGAAKELADIAARPPATRVVKVEDCSTYYERQYVGERVKRLNAIHRAEKKRLFALAQVSGRYADFGAHCRMTVQAAVGAAVGGGFELEDAA